MNRYTTLAGIVLAAATLTGCGSSEDPPSPPAAASATATPEPTEAPATEQLHEEHTAPPPPPQMRVGQSAYWFPTDGGEAKVTLLRIRYIQGEELPRGVKLQLRVRNVSAVPINPSELSAEYVTNDGRRYSDIAYFCTLDDTERLDPGQYVEGCDWYDLPAKPGRLVYQTADPHEGYTTGFEIPLDPRSQD